MNMLFYDLHIHSCLSPCGDGDMTPANIAGMAAVKGLDVIALTDHNSCRNCPAAMRHAEALGITLIPGMELTTSEEVHVVCLFPSLEAAMDFDSYVYAHLLPVKNRPDIFGEQLILDEKGYALRRLCQSIRSEMEMQVASSLTEEEKELFRSLCLKMIKNMEGEMESDDTSADEIHPGI